MAYETEVKRLFSHLINQAERGSLLVTDMRHDRHPEGGSTTQMTFRQVLFVGPETDAELRERVVASTGFKELTKLEAALAHTSSGLCLDMIAARLDIKRHN